MSTAESSLASGFFGIRRENQLTASGNYVTQSTEANLQAQIDVLDNPGEMNDNNHSSLSTASQTYYNSLSAERALRRSVAISTMQLGGGIETAMVLASLINGIEQPLVNEVEVEVASGVKG